MNEEEQYLHDIKALVLFHEHQQNLSNAGKKRDKADKALKEFLSNNKEPELSSIPVELCVAGVFAAIAYGVYRLGAWIFGSSLIWMAICAAFPLFFLYYIFTCNREEDYKKQMEKYTSEKTALEVAKNKSVEQYNTLKPEVEAMKSYIKRESSIPPAYHDKAEVLAYYYFYKGIRNLAEARQELNHDEMMGLLQQTKEEAKKQNLEIRQRLKTIDNNVRVVNDNIKVVNDNIRVLDNNMRAAANIIANR